MSSFTKTTPKTSSQVEQKPFVVPTDNNGRWKRVSRRPEQQGRRPQRYGRRPQQHGRRPQQNGRRLQQNGRRPNQHRRFNNNNRRNNYRKRQLVPQKGTQIGTGSLLDMAMTKSANGARVVKVQTFQNGKRVLKHASLSQVLKKKEFTDSSNSFSALNENTETIRKVIPRPSIVKTVSAPQGKWGSPLSNAVKEEGEFKYEAGSELEKKHLERLAQLEQEKLEQQELDRQIRTGEYLEDDYSSAEDEDNFQDDRKLGEGYEETDDYDLSCQPDVDDDYYQDYWDAHDENMEREAEEQQYNHQAEIQQLDGWYD